MQAAGCHPWGALAPPEDQGYFAFNSFAQLMPLSLSSVPREKGFGCLQPLHLLCLAQPPQSKTFVQ